MSNADARFCHSAPNWRLFPWLTRYLIHESTSVVVKAQTLKAKAKAQAKALMPKAKAKAKA